MKVKLQYTVDIEEVPLEISRLLDKAITYSEQSSTDLAKAAAEFQDSLPAEEFYDLVNKARGKMVHSDLLLSDCLAIMASYNAARANNLVEKIIDQEAQEIIEE